MKASSKPGKLVSAKNHKYLIFKDNLFSHTALSEAAIVIRKLYAVWLMALAGIAAAQQDYPNKPIRIVVSYPPGGSNDFLARLFAPRFSEMFGRQVVIDNRGGGNTIIGTELVAKSAPDGYTLLLAAATQKISTMPEIKAAIAKQGLDSYFATSEQMDAVRREDIAAVGKIIKATNIRIQE
jgi:tripartite-type tricarboxylate transporter receptor subunit TctC